MPNVSTGIEHSLIIVKPDAVQRGLIGRITARFETKGLKLAAMKMIRISRELAEQHYQEHKGKEFYDGLVDYITSGPVVVMVLAGPAAIDIVRRLLGPTNAADAPGGTIRGDFGMSLRYNLCHGSDSPESAKREIDLFFRPDERIEYDRPILNWVWQT